MSYIVIPSFGAKNDLLEDLNSRRYCEAFPADNEDILVLVTDTPDKKTDKELHTQLNNLPTLESLSMTFGCNDEQPMGEGDENEGQ
ncbi:MAG: hypothetical protein ABFS18_08845 [Thermodesulfobacteriota bacterium]